MKLKIVGVESEELSFSVLRFNTRSEMMNVHCFCASVKTPVRNHASLVREILN